MTVKAKKGFLASQINVTRERNIWRGAAGLFAAVTLGMAWALMWQATHIPSYLVPHEWAASRGPVLVAPHKAEDAYYLTYIAAADIKLLLDWTPDNIGQQYTRFLNRATPELYAAEQVPLTTEARDFSSAATTSTFHLLKASYIGDGLVELDGTQVRWEGGTEIFRKRLTYQIHYAINDGMPAITHVQLIQRGVTDE